jgi:hypothetical protein
MEMPLAGVSSIEAAEAFLPRFVVSYDVKFAVAPKDPRDAHRAPAQNEAALEEVLARREERVPTKTLAFSCGGIECAVKTMGPGLALGAKITLPHFLDVSLRARFQDEELAYTAYGANVVPVAVQEEKTIHARLDAIMANLPKIAPATKGAAERQLAQGCG